MAKDMEDEMLDRITKLGPNETDGPVKTAPITADYLDAMVEAYTETMRGIENRMALSEWPKLENGARRAAMESAYNAARKYFETHGALAELVQPEVLEEAALTGIGVAHVTAKEWLRDTPRNIKWLKVDKPQPDGVALTSMTHPGTEEPKPEEKPEIDWLAINKMCS